MRGIGTFRDRETGVAPLRKSAGEIEDALEPVFLQEGCRNRRPRSGLALRDQCFRSRERIHPIDQVAKRDMAGTRKMTCRPLGLTPDVNHQSIDSRQSL